MNRAECLVFLKSQERTESILSLAMNTETGLYCVRFVGQRGKEYSYKPEDVRIYRPEPLDPDFYDISYSGTRFTGIDAIYRYSEIGYWCIERNGKHYLISDSRLEISHSVLEDRNALHVLSYLKEISCVSSLKDEDGNKILAKHFSQIDFVDDKSVLARYLSGNISCSELSLPSVVIYPFGINRSQKKAVVNALSNNMSIIQGPPGTGKTQTILTIIANLLMQDKTAEIVSNNNSAVDNVMEKLEGYGLSFLLASLGSRENKDKFILSQSGSYPDTLSWELDDDQLADCSMKVKMLDNELDDFYEIKEKRQRKEYELSELETEIQHFLKTVSMVSDVTEDKLSSEQIIGLLNGYSVYFQKHERFSLLRRIAIAFFSKRMSWNESGESGAFIISRLQWRYYCKRKEELQSEIESLDCRIRQFDMRGKEMQLSELSLMLLKGTIRKRLKNKLSRRIFTADDIWKNPKSVIAEYPIITSTAFSSSSSLCGLMYDYVIVDEASQCDIASGALSLLSAHNAVIVGDTRQLQNVVTEEDRAYTESVFGKYTVPEAYRYSSFSFLSSVSALFPDIPASMLSEHYRCQPRIIGFCNEKFYDNALVIMTEDESRCDEMGLFLTSPGFHSRKHANLRQAEVIAKEVLPSFSQENGSIGIITPYQNNVRLIREVIRRDDIKVDTIHSFQGREMDTIILATSDDIITDFSDSPMLVNVAVSRARKHFILVASSDPQPADSNIHDLIAYIAYNSFQTTRSGISSVFDMLYEQATACRMEFLAKHRRISAYDSENLMFAVLEDIINSSAFRSYGFRIACHYPVRYLFNDYSKVSEEERSYLMKAGTHVDFLVYRSIGRVPVVAIEVDGFHYHRKGSQQYQRDAMKNSIFSAYGMPLIRFRTNGSGEIARIEQFLTDYISH